MEGRIFYGVNGEGLGHAVRTLSMIEQLPECEIHVFTYGKAFDYFSKQNYPYLHKIDGLMFSYTNNAVNYFETFKQAAKFFLSSNGLRNNLRIISDAAASNPPDLIISDFEPSTARSAKKLNKKLISIDNQHRFAYIDLIDMPLPLRIYGWCVGLSAQFLVPRPHHTIISTFHWELIDVRKANVTLTNGFIRKALVDKKTTWGDFVLIYLRHSIADTVLEQINKLPYKFKIYGTPKNSKWLDTLRHNHRFEFKELGPHFVDDLASCNSIIATSGNQLLTETAWFNKPILCIPEPKQYEQEINALYAKYMGFAQVVSAKDLTSELIEDFVNEFRSSYYCPDTNLTIARDIVRRYLSHHAN